MNPEELTAEAIALCGSAVNVARTLSVSERTVRRWHHGGAIQSAADRRNLEALVRRRRLLAKLKALVLADNGRVP